MYIIMLLINGIPGAIETHFSISIGAQALVTSGERTNKRLCD